MTATTTSILVSHEGYFTADLDNGGVRIGLLGTLCFDFPADHAEYPRVKEATPETVEGLFDDYFARYM